MSNLPRQANLPGVVGMLPGKLCPRPVTAASAAIRPFAGVAKLVRDTYCLARSDYESMRAGRVVQWRCPRRYDGADAVRFADAREDSEALSGGAKSVWLNLSEFFVCRAIDPAAYIRLQFEELGLDRPPEPLQLKAEKYLSRWVEAGDKIAERIATSLLIQKQTATREIIFNRAGGTSADTATVAVLLNERLDISALFRYCLARSIAGESFEKIAEYYRERAVMQFLAYRREYSKSWADWLPADFVEAVDLECGRLESSET